MAEWFCKSKTESLISLRAVTPPPEGPPPDVAPEPSFYLEPDRIAGLGPELPTPEDELVTIFLSSMAGFIMKTCETKDCMKRINIIKPPPPPPVVEVSDEEMEPEPTFDAAKAMDKKKSTLKGYGKRKSKTAGGGGKTAPVKKPSEQKTVRRISEVDLDHETEDQRKSLATAGRRTTQLSTPAVADKGTDHDVGEEEEEEEERRRDESEEITEEIEEVETIVKRLGKRHSSMQEIDRKFYSWKFRELDQMVAIDFIHNNNELMNSISSPVTIDYKTDESLKTGICYMVAGGIVYEYYQYAFKNAMKEKTRKNYPVWSIQTDIHLQKVVGTQKSKEFVWPPMIFDHSIVRWYRYNGRISRMLMEEFGKFTWNNGQTYKGTFKRGFCDGNGIIEWNAQSIYEGQVYCNLRHGTGVKTYVDLGKRMYHAGLWKHGKKDGKGISVYDDGDWYDGEWVNGQRMGVGTRRYKNGVRYHGQWYRGMRHGRGTMIWPNNDVYMGEWYFGQMHGRGKYTWNSFMNERLLPPMTNTYTGEWCQNNRHGDGVLELMTGGVIKTKWYDGEKSGTAHIICRNGNLLQINDLFTHDRVAPVLNPTESRLEAEKIAERRRSITNDQNFVKIRFHNDEMTEDLKLSGMSSEENEKKLSISDTPVVPVNAPVHTMDYTPHINKLFEIKCTSLLPLGPNDPKPPVIPAWEKRAITWLENKWLQKVLIRRMGDLTKVYNFYSLILSDLDVPKFKFCMHRMSLWLLMTHCGLSETSFNTVKLDELLGFGHDPFDKVMMYEMINYLLTLSWFRYVPKRRRNSDIPGIIAACFDRFIEEVVIPAPSKYDGKFHKFLKFTPFECLNHLYSTFDYPMKIEDLCARLLYVTGKDFEDKLPFTPPYYKYILQGKNIVGPDGYLSYVPYEIPHFDLNKMKLRPEAITPADLRVLGLIGIPGIVRCIKEAVPEAANVINDELDSEYELSFNDFCDILVNLVTVYLDMSEEYYRKILDKQEKEKGSESIWATDAETAHAQPKGGESQSGAAAAAAAAASGKPAKMMKKRMSQKRMSRK